jgi:hypothetical protein
MPLRIRKAPQNRFRQNIQERRIAGDSVDALLAHELGLGKFGLRQTYGIGGSHVKPLSTMRDAMQAAL